MDGDLVLQRQRFLRRLVSELTRDEHAAEDLAQSTWLRALERPPREGTLPRAWLARVARNLAINRGRAESARRSQEAQGEQKVWPSAGEVAAQLELVERVLAAVRALPEPLGAVVLARYYEELPAEEIARRSGLPLETVKDRLKRARELLRIRLGREFGEERGPAAWGSWLGDLVRRMGGGLLVKKALAFAALVLVCLWWSQAGRDTDQRPPSTERIAPLLGLEVSPLGELGIPTERTEVPATPAAVPDTGTLLLTVRWSDGTPAERVTARIWPDEEREFAHFFRLATTREGGRVSVEGLSPGRRRVQLDREREFDRVEIRGGEESALELRVSTGPRIEGLVVDGNEQPVPGAQVWLANRSPSQDGPPLDDAMAAISASDGSFTIRSAGSARAIGARAEGFAPSVHKRIEASGDAVKRVRLVLDQAGGTIEGRVLDADGAPLAGAVVSAEVGLKVSESRLGSTVTGQHILDSLRIATLTDAVGEFRFGGVQPGDIELTVFAPDHVRWRRTISAAPQASAWIEVNLERGGRVSGRIRMSDGTPLGGALVFASLRERAEPVREDSDWLAQSWRNMVAHGSDDFAVSRTEPEGYYSLAGLPAGWTYVAAETEEAGRKLVSLELAPGGAAELDLVLARGLELRLRLVDSDDTPLAGLSVYVARMMNDSGGTSGSRGPFLTDETGRIAVPNCLDASYKLDIRHARYGRRIPCTEAAEGRRPGPEEHRLVLDYADPEPATVHGLVLDEDGTPIEGAVVGCKNEQEGFSGDTTRSDVSGAFHSSELEPGVYRISVQDERHARTAVGTFTLGAGQRLDLGPVLLRPAGFLVLRLERADGGPVDDRLDLYLDSATERRVGGTIGNIELGVARFNPLAPGDYVLHARGDGLRDPRLPVRIEAGRTSELAVDLFPGGSHLLRFVGRRDPLHPSSLHVVVRGSSGEVTFEDTVEEDGVVGFLTGHTFDPGSYTVEAECVDGRRASGAFQVLDLVPQAEPLEFELH